MHDGGTELTDHDAGRLVGPAHRFGEACAGRHHCTKRRDGSVARATDVEHFTRHGWHMLFAARAHTDRLVLEAFVAGIE